MVYSLRQFVPLGLGAPPGHCEPNETISKGRLILEYSPPPYPFDPNLTDLTPLRLRLVKNDWCPKRQCQVAADIYRNTPY